MNTKAIIQKYKELVSNLTIQLVTPEPTTAEAEYKRVELVCLEDKLRKELSLLQEQGEPSKDKKEMRDFILSEYEKGNIVFASVDGLHTASIDEFLKQPEEGILYDLNRSEMVVLAFIDDPKWVNDYAMCKVVRKLLAKVEKLESVTQSGKELREDTFKKNLIIKPTYCTGVSTAVETYHVVDGQGTVWFQGTYIDCQEYLKSNQ